MSLRPHGLQHARPPCPSPTPGVHHTHVHWVGDAIQPSHPLSSPSPPAFNLSQHQGLSGDQSIGVSASTSVLPMNIQDWSALGWTGWISLQFGLSRVFSNTTVQKHQFFRALFHLIFITTQVVRVQGAELNFRSEFWAVIPSTTSIGKGPQLKCL